MNEPNAKPRFETPEEVAAYVHNGLMRIASCYVGELHERGAMLTCQLMSDMAAIHRRDEMTPSTNNPNRYDLADLAAQPSGFDE